MERRIFSKNNALDKAGEPNILNFPALGKNAPGNNAYAAIMGLNGRGSCHAKKFSAIPGVEVACLCGVEEEAIKKGGW